MRALLFSYISTGKYWEPNLCKGNTSNFSCQVNTTRCILVGMNK